MPDILHRVGIDAAPAKVFTTLTTIEGSRRWWVRDATGDAGKDGLIDFGFCRMQVIAFEPDRLVRWRCVSGPKEWVGTEVGFRLRHDKETFVLFDHSGWKEPNEFMHHCSTKWATFLLSLKHEVEHGTGRPLPDDVKIIVASEMSA